MLNAETEHHMDSEVGGGRSIVSLYARGMMVRESVAIWTSFMAWTSHRICLAQSRTRCWTKRGPPARAPLSPGLLRCGHGEGSRRWHSAQQGGLHGARRPHRRLKRSESSSHQEMTCLAPIGHAARFRGFQRIKAPLRQTGELSERLKAI